MGPETSTAPAPHTHVRAASGPRQGRVRGLQSVGGSPLSEPSPAGWPTSRWSNVNAYAWLFAVRNTFSSIPHPTPVAAPCTTLSFTIHCSPPSSTSAKDPSCHTAKALLQGLCRRRNAALAMRQGLCCTAMLQGLCRAEPSIHVKHRKDERPIHKVGKKGKEDERGEERVEKRERGNGSKWRGRERLYRSLPEARPLKLLPKR